MNKTRLMEFKKSELKENIRQHYLPKCYLKRFSPDEKQVFIYDKKAEKSFSNSIDSIAFIEGFYDLPEKFVKNINELPFKTKFLEKKFFANSIENIYNQLLEKIESKSENWIKTSINDEILSNSEKEYFAQLIIVQYLRMPNFIDKHVEAEKKIIDISSEIIKSILSITQPDKKDVLDSLQVKYDQDYNSILHSELYLDEDLTYSLADQLLNKHWVYFVSPSNDFYTSDNPILIKPHLSNQPAYFEGFGMHGAEIIFPIGSSVLLTIWDNNYFSELEKLANLFHLISDKERRGYNCLQYIWANKQVYSHSADFELIERLKILNSGKEIFMKRPSIEVNGG